MLRSTASLLRRLLPRWGRLGSLSWAERRVVAESFALLPLAHWALRVRGLQEFRARLVRDGRRRRSAAPLDARRVAELVEATARVIPAPSNCLQRSGAVAWMLVRHGVQPDLRIGVRKVEGALQFHAWVEVDGEVINDASDVGGRYTPFGGSTPPNATFT